MKCSVDTARLTATSVLSQDGSQRRLQKLLRHRKVEYVLALTPCNVPVGTNEKRACFRNFADALPVAIRVLGVVRPGDDRAEEWQTKLFSRFDPRFARKASDKRELAPACHVEGGNAMAMLINEPRMRKLRARPTGRLCADVDSRVSLVPVRLWRDKLQQDNPCQLCNQSISVIQH